MTCSAGAPFASERLAYAQSCSDWLKGRRRQELAGAEDVGRNLRSRSEESVLSWKSGGVCVRSESTLAVAVNSGSYFRFTNPGRRRTRVASVAAGSAPNFR